MTAYIVAVSVVVVMAAGCLVALTTPGPHYAAASTPKP